MSIDIAFAKQPEEGEEEEEHSPTFTPLKYSKFLITLRINLSLSLFLSLLLQIYYTALTTLDSDHEFSFFPFSHFVPSQIPLFPLRRRRRRLISPTHLRRRIPLLLPFPVTDYMILRFYPLIVVFCVLGFQS